KRNCLTLPGYGGLVLQTTFAVLLLTTSTPFWKPGSNSTGVALRPILGLGDDQPAAGGLGFRISFRTAACRKGPPNAAIAKAAANNASASKLSRPSRSQYTSRRLSHNANSSSVSAAPTP